MKLKLIMCSDDEEIIYKNNKKYNKRKKKSKKVQKTKSNCIIKTFLKVIISLYLLSMFLIIFFPINQIQNFININTNNNYDNANILMKKYRNREFCDIKTFISLTLRGVSLSGEEFFPKNINPKISIIIGTFNAEFYIKNAILSIQNQNFKDIEIIIVDDASKDNTVTIIKELMKNDKRIELFQNQENKGTLYNKASGVLNAKGKYVMVLDQDDIYTQKDVFSTLYSYSEQNNLDIIGFSSIFTNENNNKVNLRKPNNIVHYFETPILHQPEISNRMYNFTEDGTPIRVNNVIWDYMYRTELFKESIKQIDPKFMNTKMICHEDFLLFFLLTRNAKSLKYIKRLFYINIQWNDNTNDLIKFSRQEKNKMGLNFVCLSYINYIEFILLNTNNTFSDKKIAMVEFNSWYFNNECRNNEFIRERGKNVCKLYLENPYIDDNEKNKIRDFINLGK